jgi:hypothetical protein
VSWDSRFAEPIDLPSGVRLASLRDAIVHLVNTVPSSERGIATLRALNRHVERVLNPDIVKTRIGAAAS